MTRDEIAALLDGATPGPWQAETVRTSCGVCHKVGPWLHKWRHGATMHACIYDDYPSPQEGTDAMRANARLIAAAPAIAFVAIAAMDREAALVARVATARADALREAAAVVDALNRQGPYQAIIAGREILALIDSPAPAAALMAWVQARGITIQEMRANLLASEDGQKLYQQGDCTLVWVNGGGLSVLSMLRAQADMATPDEGWAVAEDGSMMPEDMAAKIASGIMKGVSA